MNLLHRYVIFFAKSSNDYNKKTQNILSENNDFFIKNL